jgi:hypothetical protein
MGALPGERAIASPTGAKVVAAAWATELPQAIDRDDAVEPKGEDRGENRPTEAGWKIGKYDS